MIGCDWHARQPAMAMVDTDTGEVVEKPLEQEGEQVREFSTAWAGPVLVGMEAPGSRQGFLQLMEELKIGCRGGPPAKIRQAETRQQKPDRREARLLLQGLVENRCPGMWRPSTEQRDRRTWLRHRQQGVRRRARGQHRRPSMALRPGRRRGRSLGSPAGPPALQAFPVAPDARQRRAARLGWYPQGQKPIDALDPQVREPAGPRPQGRRWLTPPGVGPVTALATAVFLGAARRCADGQAVASYLGRIPRAPSRGGRPRLGALSQQGHALVRALWCAAARHAVRRDPEWQRFARRKRRQPGLGQARGAAARKLGSRLWSRLRDPIDDQEFCRRQRRQKNGACPCGDAGG